MKLKRYNDLQCKELQRVHDEIKWYLGEELKRDPSMSKEDRALVEAKFSEIIINGFGKHLAQLNQQMEKPKCDRCGDSDEMVWHDEIKEWACHRTHEYTPSQHNENSQK